MARYSGFLDRALIPPLLLLNFALYAIVLGIAGWALDSTMDGITIYGNPATGNFTVFTLIAGAVGMASIFAGVHLARLMTSSSSTTYSEASHAHHAASVSSAFIAWLLLLLAFGLACKEIDIGHTGTTLKFMEAFVIILTFTHGLYLMILHANF